MKKYLLLLVSLWAILASAQTQQGYVKTKGRMVNGQHVPGSGLPGATVTISGERNMVAQGNNGAFSFPVTSKTFMVQSVQKIGYELIDVDVTKKPYQYSANPLYLIMEKPEQQAEDKLVAEQKIRRTLQRQLQKREDELEKLKEQNKLTQEEYRKALQQLYDDQKNNEKLIAEMAKEYAMMDYDQMDEKNRQIEDAILNGRLAKADSLLRSKGDINFRIAQIKKEQEMEIVEEKEISYLKKELAHREMDLEISKGGIRKKIEDIALDCFRKAELFRIDYKLDSVIYYLELRAELDTTNAQWQFDAGYSEQQYSSSPQLKYYNRVISITKYNLIGHNLYLYSTAANNLGAYYSAQKKYQDAISFYKIGIRGRKIYAEQSSNPNDWNHVAWSLLSLSSLYIDLQQFEESKDCLAEATEIYDRIRPTFYDGNIYSYGRLYDNWGRYYLQFGNLELADKSFVKAWNCYKTANEKDPYPVNYYSLNEMRRILNWSISPLYKKLCREGEIEKYFLELKGLFQKAMPFRLKELEKEYAFLLFNLVQFYSEGQRNNECETISKEALEIHRNLALQNPQVYEPAVAQLLGNLSFYAILRKDYSQSEQYAREGLAIDSAQHWIATNLASALLFQGKYKEAETIYRKYKDELHEYFLNDLNQFEEDDVIPKEREEDVEKIKRMLKG